MNIQKRINIKELAKKIGVSVTSVSRALNGYTNISLKTKDKIFKAAQKYNYFPNLNAQRLATEKVFRSKKIPFRSFYLKKRSEETLGELFCFFTLEVILLSHLLKVDPLNQPDVELVKKETFKILQN